MKLKVEILKIRCERTTYEFSYDEVYFALFIATAKQVGGDIVPGSSENALFGEVSEVKERVKAGSIWRPELNNIETDIGDAEAVSVSFALYEKDNGDLYENLKTNVSGAIDYSKTDWPKEIPLPTSVPTGIAGWAQLVLSLSPLIKSIINYFRKDDLLGDIQINLNTADPDLSFPREFEIRKQAGKYTITLLLTLTE